MCYFILLVQYDSLLHRRSLRSGRITKLETKASSQQGQCIPAGSNVSLVENVEKKQRLNRCIGDAIDPQIDRKLTKKCGSKFDVLLWRHVTPETKTAI